jgi:NCS1 family nucleobase:cation symporter-1
LQVVQPWQLINKAATWITVLSSFAVFLAPLIGIMACDFYILRRQRIELNNLNRTHNTTYSYWHDLNMRAIPSSGSAKIPNFRYRYVSMPES